MTLCLLFEIKLILLILFDHRMMDGLPVGVRSSEETGSLVYRGFPVGVADNSNPGKFIFYF